MVAASNLAVRKRHTVEMATFVRSVSDFLGFSVSTSCCGTTNQNQWDAVFVLAEIAIELAEEIGKWKGGE